MLHKTTCSLADLHNIMTGMYGHHEVTGWDWDRATILSESPIATSVNATAAVLPLVKTVADVFEFRDLHRFSSLYVCARLH